MKQHDDEPDQGYPDQGGSVPGPRDYEIARDAVMYRREASGSREPITEWDVLRELRRNGYKIPDDTEDDTQ